MLSFLKPKRNYSLKIKKTSLDCLCREKWGHWRHRSFSLHGYGLGQHSCLASGDVPMQVSVVCILVTKEGGHPRYKSIRWYCSTINDANDHGRLKSGWTIFHNAFPSLKAVKMQGFRVILPFLCILLILFSFSPGTNGQSLCPDLEAISPCNCYSNGIVDCSRANSSDDISWAFNDVPWPSTNLSWAIILPRFQDF